MTSTRARRPTHRTRRQKRRARIRRIVSSGWLFCRRQPYPSARCGKSHPGGGTRRDRSYRVRTQCAKRRAVAACIGLGIDPPSIRKRAREFSGLAHRMQQVGHKGNVLFVNDLEGHECRSGRQGAGEFSRHLLDRGRQAENWRNRQPRRVFPRIRKTYLIGEAAGEFAKTLEGRVPYEISRILPTAVEAAARDATSSGLGSRWCCSPACASFDQYPNFEVRGKAFTDIVQALPGVTATVGPKPRRGSLERRGIECSRARNARPSANGGGRWTGSRSPPSAR